MSDDLTFDDLVYHLTENPDAAARAEAARILGDFVDELHEDEYDRAFRALNDTLLDPDPQVLMAVMSALTHYNRRATKMESAAQRAAEHEAIVSAKTCSVCGKPEALADPTTCSQADCPYR